MKYLKTSSFFIVILAFLSLHTFLVKNYTLSSKKEGVYGSLIMSLIYIPELFLKVINSNDILGIPAYYVSVDSTFKPFNNLSEDIYGSYSIFNKESDEWEVHLHNFKTEKTLYKWQFKEINYDNSRSPRFYTNSEIANPIVLADSSVIAGHIGSYNFFKLDKYSNVIWRNNNYFIHHSTNLDSLGNIWVCGRKKEAQTYHSASKKYTQSYIDDLIVLLDAKTGITLFEKSLIEILKNNNYHAFAFGMNGAIKDQMSKHDPTHLNDIQPVLNSGKYSKVGDVWISMRNNSTVFLYRPSTNKIIHLLNGPLIHQHDVDILNDSVISIFNNNYITHQRADECYKNGRVDTLESAQIITYNLASKSFNTVLKKELIKQRIHTPTEGLLEFSKNGYLYLEAQNNGKLYFYKNDRLECQKYFNNDIKGYTEVPHWIRIYKDLDFK